MPPARYGASAPAVSFSTARLSFHALNVFDYYYVERPAFLAAPRRYFIQLRFDF